MASPVGIGDCLAVIDLAKKLTKEFLDAPKEYSAISDELDNVLTVLYVIKRSLDQEPAIQNEAISTALKPLEDLLIEIFGVLLKHGGLSTESPGRGRKFWDRLRWSKERISGYRARLSFCLVTVNTLLQESTRSDTTKLIQQKEHEEILEWLGPADHLAQHTDHCRQRLSGTGAWLLDSDGFRKWADGEILLLHGIPGTGKTVLASIVIDKVKACYYYCDYTRQEEQTLVAILLSLLRQLVTERVPTVVRDLYKEYRNTKPDIATIKWVIGEVVSSEVYIVIDALDECQIGCRRELVFWLLELNRVKKVNILCTSRPLPEIVSSFKNIIEIRASKEDISRYIDENLTRMPRFVKGGLVKEIKTAIIDAADGIFLLVGLHFRALEGQISARAIRLQLSSLVSTYALAYTRTMKRIADRGLEWKKLALDALTWVVYAERPLKRDELLHALAVDGPVFYEDAIPDIDDVLESCCGLLALEQGTDVVRLIHKTTEEFFKENGKDWLLNPHTKISNVLNNYLSFEELNNRQDYSMDELLARFSLYKYASLYWESHMGSREQSLAPVELAKHLDRIDEPSQELTRNISAQYLKLSHEYPEVRGLHLASLGGFTEIILAFLEDQDVNSLDKFGMPPIYYAVKHCKQQAVELLAKHGANTNVLGPTRESLLELAITSGDYETAKILIDSGSDVDQIDSQGRTLLFSTVDSSDVEIFRLLIDGGAVIVRPDGLHHSLLMLAVRNDNQEMVEVLIQSGFPLENADEHGKTALLLSVELRMPPIATCLIQAGARFDVRDRGGRLPFKTLLQHYSAGQVLMRTGQYWHKDFLAIFFPNIFTLGKHWLERQKILLDNEIVEHALATLLEDGLDTNSIDDGRSLLTHALCCGYNGLAKKLADTGAELTVKGLDDHRKLLDSVCERGSAETLAIILQTKIADRPLNRADRLLSMNLLELAVSSEVPQSLLPFIGPTWPFAGSFGRRTTLHKVVETGSLFNTKLLLLHGADIMALTSSGATILHTASHFGRLEIIEYLLQYEKSQPAKATSSCNDGSLLHILDGSGANVLHYAVARAKFDVLDYFLQRGVDPSKEDYCGYGLLDYASRSGSWEMLQKVGSYSRKTSHHVSSWSPFHWIARNGNIDMIRELIRAGFRSTIVETTEPPVCWTPMDLAYYFQNTNLIDEIQHIKDDPEIQGILTCTLQGVTNLDPVGKSVGAYRIYEAYRMNDFMDSKRVPLKKCVLCHQTIKGTWFEHHSRYTEGRSCLMCKHTFEQIYPASRWTPHDA